MSDQVSPEPAKPTPPLISSDFFGNIPQLVYLFYLVSFLLHPLWPIGAVVALVCRRNAEPLARSHYDFQVETFWRGLLMALLGFLLLFVYFLGLLVFLFTAVWIVARSIRGLQLLSRGEPVPPGIGWGFG